MIKQVSISNQPIFIVAKWLIVSKPKGHKITIIHFTGSSNKIINNK